MIKMLLVSREKEKFLKGVTGAEEVYIHAEWAGTAAEALSAVETKVHDVVLTEDPLTDMDGRRFVEMLVMKNPMVSCVVSSDQEHEAFHEAYEGLGVLMQFPVDPSQEHFKDLRCHMDNIEKISKSAPSLKRVNE